MIFLTLSILINLVASAQMSGELSMGCFVALCVCSLFAAFSMKRSKAALQRLVLSYDMQSTELDNLQAKYVGIQEDYASLKELQSARDESYVRSLEGERANVRAARSALDSESAKNRALAEELAKLSENYNSLEFQRNELKSRYDKLKSELQQADEELLKVVAQNTILEESYNTMHKVTIPDLEQYVARMQARIHELNRTSFKNLVLFMWENVQFIKCAVLRVRPNTDEERRKLGDEVMGRERDIEEEMKAQGVFGMDV